MISTKLLNCCAEDILFNNIDISKMALPAFPLVELRDWEFWKAVASILLTPLYWNLVTQCESRFHLLTRLCRSPRRAVVMFAVTVTLLSVYRDVRYSRVVQSQPHWYLLQENSVLWSGYGLLLMGSLLVVSSFAAAGFYSSFMGVHFDIRLAHHATSFPYNLMSHPMYVGSTLNFLGLALVQASQAGLLLSLLVAALYTLSVIIEGSSSRKLENRFSKEKVS